MSSGVSYFEQFTWDLEQRGVSDIDVPVLILGLDSETEPKKTAPQARRRHHSRQNLRQIKQAKMTPDKVLSLTHGDVPVPVFLPDATLGAVRATDGSDLENAGIQAVVMNVFHLMQKPGSSTIAALADCINGGLEPAHYHRFGRVSGIFHDTAKSEMGQN